MAAIRIGIIACARRGFRDARRSSEAARRVDVCQAEVTCRPAPLNTGSGAASTVFDTLKPFAPIDKEDGVLRPFREKHHGTLRPGALRMQDVCGKVAAFAGPKDGLAVFELQSEFS